jgi:hypothetical protein
LSICDDIKNWEDMSSNERFMAVRDWVKGSASGWGFGDDVKVRREPPPGHPERRGGYNPDTDTIYLHPDLFKDDREDGWKYAYDTAAHESAHHVQDEMDNAYGESPEDAGSDPDAGYDGETDDLGDEADGEDGEEGEEDEEVIDVGSEERHAEATDFAEAFLEAAEDACENNPEGAESAIKAFLTEWLMERGSVESSGPSETGDWVLPGETRIG